MVHRWPQEPGNEFQATETCQCIRHWQHACSQIPAPQVLPGRQGILRSHGHQQACLEAGRAAERQQQTLEAARLQPGWAYVKPAPEPNQGPPSAI